MNFNLMTANEILNNYFLGTYVNGAYSSKPVLRAHIDTDGGDTPCLCLNFGLGLNLYFYPNEQIEFIPAPEPTSDFFSVAKDIIVTSL